MEIIEFLLGTWINVQKCSESGGVTGPPYKDKEAIYYADYSISLPI